MTIESSIKTLQINLTDTINNNISKITSQLQPIGMPCLSLDGVLPNNCIWLEGGEVSRTTYAELFAVYGVKYGSGDGLNTFKLPNCIDKVFWGATELGYLNAGLPNILAVFGNFDVYEANQSGAITLNTWGHGQTREQWGGNVAQVTLNASLSNSIYGASNTVQPPSIKVRVYTRYK